MATKKKGDLGVMRRDSLFSLILGLTAGFLFWGLIAPLPSMGETPAGPGSREFIVIGTGDSREGNIADAKEKAVADALAQGLERYLAERLGEKGMTENFSVILREILPNAGESVANYHILEESQEDENLLSVLVSVKINEKVTEEILRQHGILLSEAPPLKILFLVSQAGPQRDHVQYWWGEPESNPPLSPIELALFKEFEGRGYRPLNRISNVPEGGITEEMKVLELSHQDAIRWGTAYSADLVLLGRCEMDAGGNVSLDLATLDPASGIMVSRDHWFEEGKGVPQESEQEMDLLGRICRKAVSELTPKILANEEMRKKGLGHFEVMISGLKNFRQFREIKDFLKREIPGVKSVTQSRISGNTFSVLVEFMGPEERFTERVAASDHFPYPFEIERSVEGQILFVIK
ncbi:MAG: hypothetical protein JRJ78_11685 [Deltaproteobacteria bacterium]|nr:hypothetical protein [Deltaproteobacteria bacterium]